MQIIPRRNVCRTFDIERYDVLVIQTEFYTSIFCCICQRETRTANYASNFKSQGLIWPDVMVSIDLVAFRTFLWTVLPGLFSFLRTAFNKVDPHEVVSEVMGRPSTGGGSARDVSGIWSFEATSTDVLEMLLLFMGLLFNPKFMTQPDIRCYIVMTYVFCIHMFFSRNQFWWRHMKNHMWNI